MDISAAANPNTRAYPQTQILTAHSAPKTVPSPRAQDKITLSSKAQEALAKQGSQIDSVDTETEETPAPAVFPSFAQIFSTVTQGHADTIRAHYAAQHAENLTYDNPSTHIWNKYKNPDSPDFRSDLSKDERAWAYDQELDLLSGGRHLQMRNPYAFASAGGPPTLSSAAVQAIQTCRTQISQAIQDALTAGGISLPADVSFQLRVDPSDYFIHVTGLEDQELTEAIEQVLNSGDNGKTLHDHLKLTTPDGQDPSVTYTDGHLAEADLPCDLDDQTLSEVKRQAGPTWARYSATYDPHQEAMNEKILSLDPDSPLNTQENMDRLSAAVRVGAPEIIAEFRTRQQVLRSAIG